MDPSLGDFSYLPITYQFISRAMLNVNLEYKTVKSTEVTDGIAIK